VLAQEVNRVRARERPEHEARRIARDDLNQEERDERDADELRHDEEKPPCQVPQSVT